MTSVCILAYVLDDAEEAVFAHGTVFTGSFEYSQLQLRGNVGVLDRQSIIKVDMLLLLDKSVLVNEPLSGYHQDVGQFLKLHRLSCPNVFSFDLVTFNFLSLKMVVEAVFDGALVPRDIDIKDETRVV